MLFLPISFGLSVFSPFVFISLKFLIFSYFLLTMFFVLSSVSVYPCFFFSTLLFSDVYSFTQSFFILNPLFLSLIISPPLLHSPCFFPSILFTLFKSILISLFFSLTHLSIFFVPPFIHQRFYILLCYLQAPLPTSSFLLVSPPSLFLSSSFVICVFVVFCFPYFSSLL